MGIAVSASAELELAFVDVQGFDSVSKSERCNFELGCRPGRPGDPTFALGKWPSIPNRIRRVCPGRADGHKSHCRILSCRPLVSVTTTTMECSF